MNNRPEAIDAATSAQPPICTVNRGVVLTPRVAGVTREETSYDYVKKKRLPDATRSQEDLTIEEKVAKILARAQAPPKPRPTLSVLPTAEPEPRAGGGLRASMFAGLTLLLVLGAGLSSLYLKALGRVTAASAERLATEAEWTVISADLEEAVSEQPKSKRTQSLPARIAADRAKPRWTPVLPGLAPSESARIDILEVDARGDPGDSGACRVSVRGVAGGPQPRLMADRFRQDMEDNLKRAAKGRRVTARFESLEDAADASLEQPQATFDLVATVGPMEPLAAPRKARKEKL